jgi:hypothetical protein
MRLIQDNPYRIAGILANASEKELQKQKSKITKFASIGKQVDSEFDFPFFGNIDRSGSSITKAFAGIEQNHDKVTHSLFWFLNANDFDKIAINHLVSGDKEKAIEQWGKVTNGKEVTSKNFSCFNNIGTLKLLSESQQEIKEGIEAKIKLIDSPSFKDFVHTVADQTYTIDNQKQTEKFIDDVLKQLKGKYSSSDTLKLFSSCNVTTQKYLSQKFTEEPLYKIETQIESCKKKHNVDKDNAYELGLRLYKNTKDDLSLLKSLVGPSDLKYKMIADNLAKELLQCGIDYFKENYKASSSNSVRESSLKLMEYSLAIAVSTLIKDRAKDHIATLEEMKDREINEAIEILRSIKLAYDKACNEIDFQVSKTIMTMPYNQTINYSKVDKMKANCLNWDKVVEVLTDTISLNDVELIQHCADQRKVLEYKNLVEFVCSKLSPLQIIRIKYIIYWKGTTSTQVKSTAKKIGTATIDTAKSLDDASGGCLSSIAEYIIGFIIMMIVFSILGGIISLFVD